MTVDSGHEYLQNSHGDNMAIKGISQLKATFGFLLVLLLLLPSCEFFSSEETDKIRFGATISRTGRYAREGQAVKKGYDLWVDFVNDKGGIQLGNRRFKVEIIYYDDNSDASEVKRLTDKLISEDKVNFLLGPYSSPLTKAASDIAEKYQVPMVEGMGASDSLFEQGKKYLFAVMTPGSLYMKALLERASQLDPKPRTLAIAAEDTIFPKSTAAGVKKWAPRYGIEVIAYEEFPRDVTDLTPILTKFKALNPDIFIGSTYTETSMLFVRQSRKINFSPKIMAFSIGAATPSFADGLGSDAEFIWGSSQWERNLSYDGPVFGSAGNYAELFHQKYGEWPNYHNAEASAAAVAFQLAIEKAGTLDREQVRDALTSLDTETFYGPVRFDESGKNVSKPMFAIQIQQGTRVIVAPKEIQRGDPIYPMTPWNNR